MEIGKTFIQSVYRWQTRVENYGRLSCSNLVMTDAAIQGKMGLSAYSTRGARSKTHCIGRLMRLKDVSIVKSVFHGAGYCGRKKGRIQNESMRQSAVVGQKGVLLGTNEKQCTKIATAEISGKETHGLTKLCEKERV